ncbi:winged helix-turn-helix transcriptional regulator [Crossiella sp. SN42]|uniref:winged helix-turn-helix transcriptional regulator n=1 Tax=Crossiella sp. SN42 TaxID=2944808 RepID=UPI0035AB835D
MAETGRLLAGQWVVPVLAALSHGPLRYNVLADRIRAAGPEYGLPAGNPVLHNRTLTGTLRTMEARGLVSRHVRAGSVPPEVSYALTEDAQRLIAAMRTAR